MTERNWLKRKVMLTLTRKDVIGNVALNWGLMKDG